MEGESRKMRSWQDVNIRTACQRDLKHRVAWSTEVVARVVELYSPYFQEKYLQKRAIEFARRFYREGLVEQKERRTIIDEIEALVDEAESEGYSRNLLAPGVHLLIEIGSNDGKGSTNAVDYASLAFASHALYCQGVTGAGMPVEYVDSLTDNVYEFAWRMFCFVRASANSPLSEVSFDSINLNLTFEPLPRDVIFKSRRKPPIPESRWLADQVSPIQLP